jgi:hypothetical protein
MGCGCQDQNAKTDDFCPDAQDASTEAAEVTTKQSLQRRTLLKAAAVGSTLAALAGREGLTPFSAMAHTDTKSACTAQDIEVSSGTIINEPCTCTPGGTFPAIAAFQVTNNNNSRRKCITLHMGAGGTFGGKDFLLTTNPSGVPSGNDSNIAGNGTTQTMYALLGNVACNFGKECYPGSVVAFQTAQNSQDTACDLGGLQKYPGGQCRRQEICIVGFGATLECASSGTCGSTGSGNCSVACGGNLFLKASATGGTAGSNGTYAFTVKNASGTTVASAPAGSSSPQCLTVSSPTAGTYTLTVTDSQGCTRTASVTVAVSSITAGLTGSPGGCGGTVDFTASTTGSGTCTYEFVVAGQSQQGPGSSNTFTYDPVALDHVDGTDHSVRCHVVCGSCSADATKTVNTCATTTVS